MLIQEKPHVHFIGICGKAMGGIAAALMRQGWKITGSDEAHYSPMKEFLEAASVPVSTPYSVKNIPPDTTLVVVGKRVSEDNVELRHIIKKGLPFQSFPEFLHGQFLQHSRNAVVAGGVGKTTTSAMLTWILESAGRQPDYLIGGLAKNLDQPARFAGEKFTVLEGDEYASCFHDSRPKFLHYRPEVAVVTNIIEDHPDLYPQLSDLVAVFARLTALLPAHGCLILSADDPNATPLAATASCEVITVGTEKSATQRITGIDLDSHRSSFRFLNTHFTLPLCGLMNIRNAAIAAAAAAHWNVTPAESAAALRTFRGVANRQEEKKIGSCSVIHDKASHPFSLVGLLQALRQRHPDRRVVSIIQPRATGGKGWVYQKDLPEALAGFDKVIIAAAYEHKPQRQQAWENTPFCTDSLANDLAAQGTDVTVVTPLTEESLLQELLPGDVILISMSEQAAAQKALVERTLLTLKRRGLATVSI
ncbi:MAG: Mur ligase family protein [Chthoniobacterales bacterium]